MLLLVLLVSALVEAAGKAPVVPVGSTSRVEDAELFRLYYGQSFKVIKNSVDGNSYLLMQNDSRMAARTKYCTGRIKSFVIPLVNYSVDTTFFPVSFFELLGLLDGLRGMTSEFVTSECVLKSYATGSIQLVNQTNMQQIAQFNAHFSSNFNKVQACNLATFVPLEERTPMQRAEWIKYLATFTNLEARANMIYDAIKENYNCLTKAAANLTTHFKPIVAWVEYKQGLWGFSREDYKLQVALLKLYNHLPCAIHKQIPFACEQFVTDAGGENVDGTISSNSYNVSSPDDMENFYAILCTVDVVIDQTYASEPAEYMLSTFLENLNVDDNATFDFIKNQSLWRYDRRVQNSSAIDWYDGAISQPQLVLADLIEIFFSIGSYTPTFFRNIAKNEGVSFVGPQSCHRSTSEPLDPIIVACS